MIKQSVNQIILTIKYFKITQQINIHLTRLRMSNPLQIKLQNQMKKRINQNQVSKDDMQFYQRKNRRLESQLSISQDQVSKLRIKLKRAEDFQFKYEITFKQFTDAKSDNEAKMGKINALQALNDQLKFTVQEKSSNVQDFSIQRTSLMQQIGEWKDKYEQLQHRSKIQVQDQRIRCEQKIKKQGDKIRQKYKQQQQDFQFQIHQLKKVIAQKQTVQSIINQRVQKIRREKDEQIERLQGILQQRKQSYQTYIQQKNEQLERIKDKFEKMINFDIWNLKNNQEDQEEIFYIELNGLREMIGLKNDEIQKLLAQVARQAKQHQLNRKQLLQETKMLKEKIYVVQKQGQIQLLNLKDRLITIHAQDTKTIQDRYQKIVDSLQRQLQDSKKFIREVERIRQNQKMEHERMRSQFHDQLKEKDKRIGDLSQNLQQRGQLNASELKSLHQSFHQITSERQIMATQYQSNVTFLNQQVVKLNSINEIKTAQITKLHEQLHQLKISYEGRLIESESKLRRQRKQREQQKQQQKIQREKNNEKIQDLERQFKNKERRLERQKQKMERQRNKAQYVLEQAQKDIDRLNKYIKQIDVNLKSEFKKNQLATMDKDGLRRQILSQLQKQKIQLEAMKLMEADQLRKRYEIQNARLTTANQQLKTQLLNKSISFQNIQSEFKKLDYKNRNADKLQKDKIRQYEQKMITLTQEISITQNLYTTFLQAKARAGK